MIRILFLAANPLDRDHLRIRQERNEIRRALDSAEHGKRFELIEAIAVNAGELQELLFRHKPQIVHFSGHGDESGELLFEGDDGESQPVSLQTLSDLFAKFKQTVCCVVLNACYSQNQAAALAQHIDCVIGMNDAISDPAALSFASALYRALANGTSLLDAFDLARNQLDLQQIDEAHKPQLLAERIDVSQVRAVDWDEASEPETPTMTTTINTAGGTAIGRDVNTANDFVGRDKIEGDKVDGDKVAGSKTVIQQQTNIYQGTSSTAPPPTKAIFTVPFPRKLPAEFVGREDDLQQLHELLQQNRAVGIRPNAALTGMGGIGKTQLAVEYAYRHREHYSDGIFWINAADPNRFRAEMALATDRLPLTPEQSANENAKLSVLATYLRQNANCLLIFDNVHDPLRLKRQLTQEIALQDGETTMLITTRRHDLPNQMRPFNLKRLSEAAATQFLRNARADLANDPALPQLLKRTGCLPLMLTLAAAALKWQPNESTSSYLAALDEHGIETVHKYTKSTPDDYDEYRDYISYSLTPALREQWALLRAQPDSSTAQLLLRIAGQLPEAAEIPVARLSLLAGVEDKSFIKPLSKGLKLLADMSLIERLQETQAIRLHPLVRDFAEGLTPPYEQSAFRITCIQHVHYAYCQKDGLLRLGEEYEQRGIFAVITDLITAIKLLQSPISTSEFHILNQLQSLLQLLRHEAYKLTNPQVKRERIKFWQQVLFYATIIGDQNLMALAIQLMNKVTQWIISWCHNDDLFPLEQTLAGHSGNINAVALLDSEHVISASGDNTLKVWDLTTGEVEQTLIGHNGRVWSVAVIDRNRVISASMDGTLRIWNLETGQVEGTLIGRDCWFYQVVKLDDNRVASASSDETIRIWNLETSKIESEIINEDVICLAVLDQYHLVLARNDDLLKVWNIKTNEITKIEEIRPWINFARGQFLFPIFPSLIREIIVLDSQHILTASSDSTLKIWNLKTGAVEQIITERIVWLGAIATPYCECIVSIHHGHVLKVWRTQPDQIEKAFFGPNVDNTKFSDGIVIVPSANVTIKVWKGNPTAMDPKLDHHKDAIIGLSVLDSLHVRSISMDNTIKVWNINTGHLEQSFIGAEKILSDAVSTDTHMITFKSIFSENITVWNLNTYQTQILNETSKSPTAIAIIDNMRFVAAMVRFDDKNKSIDIWNIETGTIEHTEVWNGDFVTAILPLDQQRILLSTESGELKIWNLRSCVIEETLEVHEGHINALTTIDEHRIVYAASDHTLGIWNLETSEVEQILVGHENSVNAVAVIDAKHIVSASNDQTLKVWNLETGKEIASIGLDGTPQCVAVTRQGERTLVMAGDSAGSLYCLELVEPKF